MSHHDKLLEAFEAYKAENEKFQGKGIKASAARARKALQEIAGSCKERRKEITAEKESREERVQVCHKMLLGMRIFASKSKWSKATFG
jgi:hypothetical protein